MRPGEFPPAFAIDAALVFAVLGQQMLREGDPLINDMMQDQIILMDIPLMNEARKTREQLIEQRAAAAAAAPTPAKKVATYIGMATEHADDHENVHDTGVNGSLRAIVQRLRHDQQDAQLPAIDKIKQEIGTMLVGDPKKLKDVSDVIDRAKNGDRNMAVGISDEEALQRVWLRADDPRNSAVRKQMKEATVKALEEAWKNDPWGGRTIRCVNGRSGLTLSSLVLLDHDQRNWHITTFEQVKNDILRKVHEYIGKRAAEAAGSPDPRLAKVGQSYLVKTSEELQALGELDQELTTKYVEEVREGIGKLVDEEAAAANKRMSGSLTAAFIEGAKKEAQAAVV